MTPDERSLLQQFLYDLGQTWGATKDQEADAMIAQVMRNNPDAMYLLVQHAILADQALQAVRTQIEQMEQQVASQVPVQSSFLGGGQQTPQPGWNQGPNPGGWNPSEPPPGQPQSPLSANGGLGSFMRSAGTMAAGVAGGEFLAQGLSNLFSRRD
ncbi:MAG: DUF2076 family protein [Caulobacteraceae bacterium]